MKKYTFITALAIFGMLAGNFVNARSLKDELAGRILIQAQSHGEAWYVDPETKTRIFLYQPVQALEVIRKQGSGITNANLLKIPVGFSNIVGTDTDGDGLINTMEEAIGTSAALRDTDGDGFDDKTEIINSFNPNGNGKVVANTLFSTQQKGRIFLQVESHGEAWWVNPVDLKRYYLGNAESALSLMRTFGLGVSNTNLDNIPISETPIDCGTGHGGESPVMTCLLASVQIGQPAKAVWSSSIDLSILIGYVANSTASYSIVLNPKTEQSAIQMITQSINMSLSEESKQTLRSSGKSEDEIVAMEEKATAEAQTAVGVGQDCIYDKKDRSTMANVIQRWNSGEISSDDMDFAECTTINNSDDELTDTDNDGLTDVKENALVTDYKNPDTDADGIADGDESVFAYSLEFIPLDPKNPDTDGDGFKDGNEIVNGFDPTAKNKKMDQEFINDFLAVKNGTAPTYNFQLRGRLHEPTISTIKMMK